ncbi:MAG TPA: hypothetical protein VNW68_04035 [Candidatus Limnocylindria bacterium]|jgi:predicted lipoprotein with Yx(FWY)xxD motif|nr:hypothetical protein [Candidatus Limnocylindria bacterium]
MRHLRFVMAVLAALALAGCAPAGGASPSPIASPMPAAGPGAMVELADSPLGQILVDGERRTLYGFVPDEESRESTCYDQCEQNWPPLLVDGELTVGEGLDRQMFSTVTRTDGSQQVRIGNYPLYYFIGDQAAEEHNGQGVNDVWYVVGADGQLIGR